MDFETANSKFHACQIGIAGFKNGEVVYTWKALVDPRSPMEAYHFNTHKISSSELLGQPHFYELFPYVHRVLNETICVHHSKYEFNVIRAELERYSDHDLPSLSYNFLDSETVTKAVWPDFVDKHGSSLGKIAKNLKIEFRHHDALEDAIASGKIIVEAAKHSGCDVQEIVSRYCDTRERKHEQSVETNFVRYVSDGIESAIKIFFSPEQEVRPAPDSRQYDESYKAASKKSSRIGKPKEEYSGSRHGRYFGEAVVFTFIEPEESRDCLVQSAVEAGFDVKPSVTHKVAKEQKTYLVVGDTHYESNNNSSKIKQALRFNEKYEDAGMEISIIKQSEFEDLLLMI